MANIIWHKFRIHGNKKEMAKFMKFIGKERKIKFESLIPTNNNNWNELWGAYTDGKLMNLKSIVRGDKKLIEFDLESRWAVPDKAFVELQKQFPMLNFNSYGYEGGMGWKYAMQTDNENPSNLVFQYSDITMFDNIVSSREYLPF